MCASTSASVSASTCSAVPVAPVRSALALFYLDFFTIAEIAELLKMSEETLSETLAAARRLLTHALRAPRRDAPAEP